MRQAPNPENGGYSPLLLLIPGIVHIGRYLGWLHPTEEPIWAPPPQEHWYMVGGSKDQYGIFCCLDDMESLNGLECHPFRFATAKGREEDGYMVASDFVRDALMMSLSNPPDLTVTVPALGHQELTVWRLNHVIGESTKVVYVTYGFQLPHDPALARFVGQLVQQRDQAHDLVLKALLGKTRSMMQASHNQGSVS